MTIVRLSVSRRRGAILFEYAIVFAVLFLLLVGIIVGGMGITAYQQVASLAREGARYACVRGGQYQQETGRSAVSDADVDNYIRSIAAGLDRNQLQPTTVTWNTSKMPYRVDLTSVPPGRAIANTVSVTVTYRWRPGVVFHWLGTITMSSTSEMPMSY